MLMTAGRGRPKEKRRAPVRRRRKPEDAWYRPNVRDVYAQVMVAKNMLDRINDVDLAVVKREMNLLEDLLWQFATE